jgi:hypothetical protein
MAISMGAEEERAMATTIASEKAADMAKMTEMKRGQGQWQREMERSKQQDGILDGDCERGQYLKRIWGGGGEGWHIISIKLIMHSSTITLTSITIKQYLSYPNINFVFSSFKVASLMWWNKRSADISSRW